MSDEPKSDVQPDLPKNPEKQSIEKFIKNEFKEFSKIEKVEVKEHKDAKHEKLEKNEAKEHKDAKHEKLEKNEFKDHKDGKHEKIEKFEIKEHKDVKIEKIEQKEIAKPERPEKLIFEGPIPENGGDPIEQRLTALEQTVSHFIGTQQRPDLSRGALSGEADVHKPGQPTKPASG